jgi:hypothetical protein
LVNVQVDPEVLGILDLLPILFLPHVRANNSNQLNQFTITQTDSLSYYLSPETFMLLSQNLMFFWTEKSSLKSFHWSSYTNENQLFHKQSDHTRAFVENIPRILSFNAESLEELNVGFEIWTFSKMEEIKLPRLRRFETSLRNEDYKVFLSFIKNHPFLEQLVVDMRYQFSTEVLRGIHKELKHLRKLSLTTAGFERSLIPGKNSKILVARHKPRILEVST